MLARHGRGALRADRPTIRDVARIAGVSIKTVSRVINGDAPVTEDTRKRVLAAIASVEYRPNAVARSLVTGRSQVVGLIVADVTNPFFPALVRGVEDAAGQHDQLVVVCNTDEDPDRELQYLDMLQRNQVDGIILAASRLDDQSLVDVVNRGYPLVLINRELRHPNVSSVSTDDVAAMEGAVRHLVDTGVTHLGYLAGPSRSYAARMRESAFRHVVTRLYPGQPVRVVSGFPPTRDGGRAAIRALLRRWPEVDGVLTYNDMMAMGVLEALDDLGISVPDRISVVGYDGIDPAELTRPPLTTVRQPAYRLGFEAYRLLRLLSDPGQDARAGTGPSQTSLKVPAELIVRGSTKSGAEGGGK